MLRVKNHVNLGRGPGKVVGKTAGGRGTIFDVHDSHPYDWDDDFCCHCQSCKVSRLDGKIIATPDYWNLGTLCQGRCHKIPEIQNWESFFGSYLYDFRDETKKTSLCLGI